MSFYARAQKAGVQVDALLVEPSSACGPRLTELLVEAAEARSNKLTSSEYDETTWSARTWRANASRSRSIHFAAAKEIAEALKMTMATDSRDGGCRVRGG